MKSLLVRSGAGGVIVMGLLLAAFGCGSPDPVVLKVGSEEIPLSVFQESFWEVTGRDSTIPRDTSGVNQFLETYIEKELMESAAAQYIPVFDEGMLDRLEGHKEGMLKRLLSKHAHGDAMTVSESELRDAYEKLKTQFHIREIRVSTQETADRILGMLHEGGIFAKIAAAQTQDEALRQKEGDMGWVTLGQIPPSVYEAASRLSVGEISPVVRSSRGFHIILLEDRRETEELLPFDEARDVLERTLSQERISLSAIDFNEELMERYHYEVVPENVIWLSNWLRDATSTVIRGKEGLEQDQPVTANDLIERMEQEDKERILVRSTVDSLNALLFIVDLSVYPPAAWPTFDSPEDALAILRSVMLTRLRLAEARRLGLDEDPSLLWVLQKKRDAILSRQFYLRHVRPQSEPTEEELRQHYDQQVLGTGDLRRYMAIHVGDATVAEEVASRLRGGESAEAVYQWALEQDAGATWTGAGGTRYYAKGESPGLDDVLFSLSEGEVSDPIPNEGRQSVLQLLRIRRADAIPFDGVRRELKTHLWNQKADRLLQEILQAVRDTILLEVDRKALDKLQLEPPEGWVPARDIIYGGAQPREEEADT